MGKVISFNSKINNSKKKLLLSNKKENIQYDSTAPRLDKTEKDSYEKACKLAGKDPLARNIILTIRDYATPMDDFVMEFINDVGIYDNKIPLLFWACDSNPYDFIQKVTSFRSSKVPREEIAKIKTKQDFLNLISKYKINEQKYEYEYYDDGD